MFRALAPLFLAAPLAAQALCSSDDAAPVATLVERFVSADCLACGRERPSAAAAADTLVIDWIVPGPRAGAARATSDDALQRLDWLHRRPPTTVATVTSKRDGSPVPLRLAQGAAFNDYIGASIELEEAGSEPWNAWLLLVERMPAGADGNPVARNVVRKVFRPEAWARAGRAPGPLAESRSMQLPAWTHPERVRLVGVLQDGRGRIRAISQTECRE